MEQRSQILKQMHLTKTEREREVRLAPDTVVGSAPRPQGPTGLSSHFLAQPPFLREVQGILHTKLVFTTTLQRRLG